MRTQPLSMVGVKSAWRGWQTDHATVAIVGGAAPTAQRGTLPPGLAARRTRCGRRPHAYARASLGRGGCSDRAFRPQLYTLGGPWPLRYRRPPPTDGARAPVSVTA